MIAALAATLLATGCFRDVHEIDPTRHVGYVVPELNWGDPALAGTEIHDLAVSVLAGDESYSKHYTDVRDIAREPLEIPAGESRLMVLANATEADGFQLSGLPATKWTLEEMMLTIGKDNPAQNCYAAASSVSLNDHDFKQPPLVLRPVLPTVVMSMRNIPEELKVLVVQGDVARSVRLGGWEDRVGAASAEQGEDRVLGIVTGDPSSVITLPTVAGKTESRLTIEVFTPDPAVKSMNWRPRPTQGIVDYALLLAFVVTSPKPLDCGMTYKINMAFDNLFPDMRFDSYTISDWEVGFTYNGRVY